MTGKKALAAARKRWGKSGAVTMVQRADGTKRHRVGRVVLGSFFEVEGEGETWEAAFADADRKLAKRSGRPTT